MMTTSSQTSQADGSKPLQSSSRCSSRSHRQATPMLWEYFSNAVCSNLESPRSLTDSQGLESQDRTPGPPSYHQNSHYNSCPQRSPFETSYEFHDSIHDDSDATPTWCSGVKSQRQTPLDDSQSEGDSSSLYGSDKEYLPSITPFQAVVSINGDQMSFKCFFEHDGRDGPVDVKFSLPNRKEYVSIKLSMIVERKEPLSRSTSYYSWKSKGAKRAY
ncbi:hypothetical protein CORC01_14414 [Colletotrichum orchidophilum]|uniref:Uncharacterized protein n=1 Tax=Colletotrichum orchidophilum TaxID=1209926 RepID=A0A1G4AMH6_9PEZI|nr:uncharacterized protein CORC01_14414 [Colletotrichum orchidophilum]OHE90285.1 hypothetical protein CORC01_14414 [Colletotrichum orchidophilum]